METARKSRLFTFQLNPFQSAVQQLHHLYIFPGIRIFFLPQDPPACSTGEKAGKIILIDNRMEGKGFIRNAALISGESQNDSPAGQ